MDEIKPKHGSGSPPPKLEFRKSLIIGLEIWYAVRSEQWVAVIINHGCVCIQRTGYRIECRLVRVKIRNTSDFMGH